MNNKLYTKNKIKIKYNINLLLLFNFQALWVFIVSLPVVFTNSETTHAKPLALAFGAWQDITGVSLWGVGLLVETFADMQKFYFKDNPRNQGKWCTYGKFGFCLRIYASCFILPYYRINNKVHTWQCKIPPLYRVAFADHAIFNPIMVELYYYGFLVNEGMDLILVI